MAHHLSQEGNMRNPVRAAVATLSVVLLSGCYHSPNPPDPAAPRGRDMGIGGIRTGSADSVRGDDTRSQHMTDVADMLQGRVPGLQVIRNGTDISLRIRGSDSINSDGEPLIILDDAPVASQSVSMVLRGLNPKEVESIDVLKDVASTAVYGTRGAHGVIIIRMKHPKP
jgi:TonB-dependent SusC/RagA subfamily outer membrane receptor